MNTPTTQSPGSLGSPSGYAGEECASCGRCGRRLELVRPGRHQCNYCERAPDYYAVYVQRGPKDRPNFLLHVCTIGGKAKALKIARDQGHKLPRWSFAVRVGKEGYYEAIKKAFSA